MSERTHKDGCLPVLADFGIHACHPAEVLCKVGYSAKHPFAIVGRCIDCGATVAIQQQVAAAETHKPVGCNSRHRQQHE